MHHYVEVDLAGFQRVVDAAGGVEMCFGFATRDTSSGLDQQPGCRKLDGAQALAYARSRHYEEFRDGDWQEDPRADLGRIERQQQFVKAAVEQSLEAIKSDPFSTSRLIDAVRRGRQHRRVTRAHDAAGALRAAAEEGLVTLELPVYGDMIGDQSVVLLDDGAEQILDYFRGKARCPTSTPTTCANDLRLVLVARLGPS